MRPSFVIPLVFPLSTYAALKEIWYVTLFSHFMLFLYPKVEHNVHNRQP